MANNVALRVQALQFATGHGLPPNDTLRAARSYLRFLDGTEGAVEASHEWMLASIGKALVAERNPTKKPLTKASAKKAAPKR
jgi:hypothetical protein